LLDTFLTDTTQFLLLRFPEAIGKNAQVPLKTLIDGRSLEAVVTDEAAKRARELAYLPFPARLEYLRGTFGLTIDLPKHVAEALEHYPTVRNSAVHDQGIFELRLERGTHVAAYRKTCPQHPTRVASGDVFKALKAYQAVFATVAKCVLAQVLKCPDHPSVAGLLRAAEHQLDTNPPAADGGSDDDA